MKGGRIVQREKVKGRQQCLFVPVAFSYKHVTTTTGTIKFDKKIVDNTNSFVTSTGVYHVPVSGAFYCLFLFPGTYYFGWTLIRSSTSDSHIRVDGAQVSGGTFGNGNYGSVAGSTVVELEEGQQVTLFVASGTIYEDSAERDMLSGFLLFTE